MIPLPIETQRLVIRPWRDDDVPALAEMFDDPVVMRYITLRGRTVQQMLDDYRRTYDERGFSFWALCDTESRVVGEVGFGVHEESGVPELGWALVRDAWGKGYAAEGARACIDALFEHTPHDRIVALVDTRNDRSLRTAERIGMRRIGEVDHPAHEHALFEVLRP